MSKSLPTVGTPGDFEKSFETSERGNTALGVYVQDQTTEVLSVPFLKERAALTLSADTAIGDRIISVDPGHAVTAGEIIELAKIGSNIFMQAAVLSVAVNDITIDAPVSAIFTTSDVVIASSSDLLVDGSVTAQIFSILPGPTQAGDMTRILISIRGPGDMDFSTFGSDASLTNGCVLRVKRANNVYRNIFNFKDIGDILEQAHDGSFLLPKGGNTTKGFTSRLTFSGQSKQGVVIRLEGVLDEELQIIIQDDLTAGTNTHFSILAQGHELQSG